MAVSNVQLPVTVTAGEALPIYRYMQLQADGKYDLASAAGLVHGVSGSNDAAADGDAVQMLLPMGIMKVEAGAAVTRGAEQASDATGRTVDHVSAAGATITGVALDAAAGAGEIIRVQLLVMQDGLT